MPSLNPTVTIEKLIYGGDGLARLDSGEIVFVPFAAPAESLEIYLLPAKKPPFKGTIKNILSASPHRKPAECVHFQRCGGCHWQHLTLDTQQAWKQKIVTENLQRIGKINFPVMPMLAQKESQAWHYRNKVEWLVNHTVTPAQMGYTDFDNNTVVALEDCLIMPEGFLKIYQWLAQHLQDMPQLHRVTLKTTPDEKAFLLTLHLSSEGLANRTALEKTLSHLQSAIPEIQGLILASPDAEVRLWGEPALYFDFEGLTFRVSHNSFFQVNFGAARQMVSYIKALLPTEPIHTLLDLYAGVGLFSMLLRSKAANVIAVESSSSATDDAQWILVHNQIQNVSYHKTSVEQFCANPSANPVDWAIIDPPRSGCKPKTLEWLSQTITDTLVYVSCDPATLARDLKHLLTQGWHLHSIQPFDMFPQTYHIETVTVLKKRP